MIHESDMQPPKPSRLGELSIDNRTMHALDLTNPRQDNPNITSY